MNNWDEIKETVKRMAEEDRHIHLLLKQAKQSSQFFIIFGTILYFILTLAVYTLIIVLKKGGALQRQSPHVKVGLALYGIYAPFMMSCFILLLIKDAFVDFFWTDLD